MPRALITGITGQDGSYLAEYLLNLGYEVHGTSRRVAMEDQEQRFSRIRHILDDVQLHSATLENYASIQQLMTRIQFDECYHLAAQRYPTESFADEFTTLDANIGGTHRLLSVLRDFQSDCRFYFAGSFEMFGKARESPQAERTPFHPDTPFGISKSTGFQLTQNFRESYGLFCCAGILFNHESPRRGKEFVTRKITSSVARIKFGLQDKLCLDDLDAQRDWGFAPEYIEAMHLMMQHSKPDDYVIATGETHSVREFCELSFAEIGLDYQDYVDVGPDLDRPADVELLVGDTSKAESVLGWRPKTSFADLVRHMIWEDLELAEQQAGYVRDRLFQRRTAQSPTST